LKGNRNAETESSEQLNAIQHLFRTVKILWTNLCCAREGNRVEMEATRIPVLATMPCCDFHCTAHPPGGRQTSPWISQQLSLLTEPRVFPAEQNKSQDLKPFEWNVSK